MNKQIIKVANKFIKQSAMDLVEQKDVISRVMEFVKAGSPKEHTNRMMYLLHLVASDLELQLKAQSESKEGDWVGSIEWDDESGERPVRHDESEESIPITMRSTYADVLKAAVKFHKLAQPAPDYSKPENINMVLTEAINYIDAKCMPGGRWRLSDDKRMISRLKELYQEVPEDPQGGENVGGHFGKPPGANIEGENIGGIFFGKRPAPTEE